MNIYCFYLPTNPQIDDLALKTQPRFTNPKMNKNNTDTPQTGTSTDTSQTTTSIDSTSQMRSDLQNFFGPAQHRSGARLVKFSLPDFMPNHTDVWFSAVDQIFKTQAVLSEDEKFSCLLQYIDASELSHIRDIITSEAADKYTRAKTRLQQIHGKSRLEQLTKLLQGVDITSQTKPSVILNKMRNLVGPNCDSNEILRSMWLQRLPQRTREILAIKTDQSLDHQAELADRLYETYETTNFNNFSSNVAAVASNTYEVTQNIPKVQQPPEMPQQPYELLIQMMQNLQCQISALQTDKSRREEHEPRPYRRRFPSRNRGRSPSPYRNTTEMINGESWYHHTFGASARKCSPGCNYPKKLELKSVHAVAQPTDT